MKKVTGTSIITLVEYAKKESTERRRHPLIKPAVLEENSSRPNRTVTRIVPNPQSDENNLAANSLCPNILNEAAIIHNCKGGFSRKVAPPSHRKCSQSPVFTMFLAISAYVASSNGSRGGPPNFMKNSTAAATTSVANENILDLVMWTELSHARKDKNFKRAAGQLMPCHVMQPELCVGKLGF